MAEESYSSWERPIFDKWQEGGWFQRTPGFGANKDLPYTIVIPPPNVTGVLHMGHALDDTLQDACIRHARMKGYKTRWILGTDHAGIATQTKVDKHLAEQGINRREIGREAFIEACQDWRLQYGTTIVNQIKAMGCSCDYADEKFTMSPEFSLAVRKVFVDWYKRGIIYRGKRIVNWCPNCTTAIADDEAEYVDEAGHLWHLRYPIKDAPTDGPQYLVVATTRPETMLGDTGVAVNPKDERYKDLVGKTVVLPIVNREIPIFADFYVDAEFGTGAVKVTPAHDPNDFAMGERAGLPKINVFDETAHVVEGYGKFSGMSRDEAREAIVAEFEALGLLDHVEDHDHSVMTCYRCHHKLEPWLSEQWFVSVEGLKGEAARVVREGEVKFYPERWSQVYLDWLENLKDWCISRQLWWGHRIPVFYCDECGWTDASLEDVDVCPTCGAPVRQDEDVLDTWFSSQLWPFATQGWATQGVDAEDIQNCYPTQVLVTARDIMGLWVARMVMSSVDCTGQIPFHDVLIYPTVMGADGKPMSKSRGNGVDPVELMKDYGADGMRFGLLAQVTGTQAIRFDVQKIESARNFANKIKNAARFITMNLDGYDANKAPAPVAYSAPDKWILSRLAKLCASVEAAYETYTFADMTRELYTFFWNEFCDWYIEFSKSRLKDDASPEDRVACQSNLVFVLDTSLKLLHPIMPFITESIYSDLPHPPGSDEMLIGAAWPEAASLAHLIDEQAERRISLVCDVAGAVRSVKSRYKISPKSELDVVVSCASVEDAQAISAAAGLIENLVKVGNLEIAKDAVKPANSSASVLGTMSVYTVVEGYVDFAAERARVERALKDAQKDVDRLEKKLSNPGFLAKAAQEIIDKDTAKLEQAKDTLAALSAELEELS
jgi:valyl-tRNA synthetase